MSEDAVPYRPPLMPLTILTCRRCGMQDTPRLSAGQGPHPTRASCAHCGGFIKWVGRARPLASEESRYAE
jgi:hypothetical protein